MKTVVIGFLGSTLDAGGLSAGRWEKWRPSVAICQQEDLVVDRFEMLYARPHIEPGEAGSCGHRFGFARDEGAAAFLRSARSLGLPGGLRRPARLRARLHLRRRARGLSRAHHHRHARRADLHVPADRGARTSPAALLQTSPPNEATCGHARHLFAHRPRPVALRPDRLAIRAREAGEHRVPEVGHRDAQRHLQPHDRPHRAASRCARARRCCSTARRAPASRSWRAASTS